MWSVQYRPNPGSARIVWRCASLAGWALRCTAKLSVAWDMRSSYNRETIGLSGS